MFDATVNLSCAKILKYMKLRCYKLFADTWPHWVPFVLLWLPGKPFLLCENVSCFLSHNYVFIKSERLESPLPCCNSLFPGIKKANQQHYTEKQKYVWKKRSLKFPFGTFSKNDVQKNKEDDCYWAILKIKSSISEIL